MEIGSIEYEKFGGAEVLKVGKRILPPLSAEEVRIRICWAGVNRADLMQRLGKYPNQKAPMKLGLECSGTIDEVGANCTSFAKGDRVMSLLSGGGYAQFVQTDFRFCIRLPDDMPLDVAAAIPEAFLTAYQLLHWVGEMDESKHVLIHGAGSGVGTSAIQLAKHHSKKIYATAGTDEKIEKAKQLGAHIAINYKEQQFDEVLKDEQVDVILDCVGGSYWQQNSKVLSRDGIWVLFGLLGGGEVEGPILRNLLSKRAQIRASTLMSRSNEYKAKLISEFWRTYGKFFSISESEKEPQIQPIIDSRFNMTEVHLAHEHVAGNKNCGKVLLKMNLN